MNSYRGDGMMTKAVLGWLAFAMATPCLAQTTPPPEEKSQIVVEGKAPAIQDLPIRVNPNPNQPDRVESASGISEARRFVRCMREINPKLLRQTIDRAANDIRARWSLDRLIRQGAACHGSMFHEPQPASPYYGDCNPIAGTKLCRSVFDRGVLFEYALARFAADLQLTRDDLRQEQVRLRFLKRELPKVRMRTPDDQRYFDVVSCVVQLRPQESLELVRLPEGSPKEGRLEALLIASAPNCFGNAKKVTVDPNQFKLYIAEAVYNWAVAFRAVDSLVPDRS
ncbi:hypothetical protein [Sphingomonas sp. R1]|uniref:hypothetical protein n=1 Tax=Sphingomonas sp. R1 TaxID=399176 RepID=UPI0022256F9C|nr:hypothetical protein [Sphingomonas sp. R1]UYY79137.1 hypothetical protein OIM94_09200 [Sphingomonas sp. R1]